MTRRRRLRPLTAIALAAPAPLAGWRLVSDTMDAPPPGPAILAEQDAETRRAGRRIGMALHASAADTVGRIEDWRGHADGRARGAVVSVGGAPRLGAREAALAWDAIEVKRRGQAALLSIEAESVRAAPAFRDRERLAGADEDRESEG